MTAWAQQAVAAVAHATRDVEDARKSLEQASMFAAEARWCERLGDGDPGPFAFAERDYVQEFLGRAGFEAIAVSTEHPDMIGGTPDEEAHYALTMGPSMRLIEEKEADPAARDAIGRDITALFAARAATGPIRLKSTVLIVTARRPGGAP